MFRETHISLTFNSKSVGVLMVIGFVNGNVYVSFKPLKKVEAFAVANGRIVFIGGNSDVENIVRISGGTVVDLGGRTVLPGFIDSHVHIDELGIFLSAIDLRGTKSLRELKERLRKALDSVETLWVLGHGWDQELFEEKKWPTRWDIDEVVSHRPALLTRICLHAAVLNTLALKVTGLEALNSLNVERDEKGVPTGVIKEEALEIAWERIRDSISVEEYEKLILNAMRFAASHGVTTIGFTGCNVKVLKALINLWSKGLLITRVRVYLNPGKSWEVVHLLENIGFKRSFGDEYLKIMGIKILADGSLGARTAWLSEPYTDNPSTSGVPSIPPEDLRKLARRTHDLGLQLSIHGIGDKAIDVILDAYSELKNVDKARHRIEHASVVREDQIDRMSRLGVVVAVQPNFVVSDWWALGRLGKKRIRWLYPFKTMLEKGIAVGFGTDTPVEPINPWQTVYAAVTRGKFENVAHYEDTKNERLDLQEALNSYTYGSAYIMFEEHSLGTLDVGKLADFVVVDRDPFTVEEKELKDVRILETYIGGKKVYTA